MKAILNTTCFGVRFAQASFSIWLLLPLLALLPCKTAEAQKAPRIFYSDLTSGPATGGESDQGAFVTVYGSGFGTTRGQSYITVGNAPAASYAFWSEHLVSFQIGHAARSGAIVLHVHGGAESNASPFQVRPGRILFYPSFNSHEPLRTVIDRLRAGDILYLRDGVEEISLDRYDASINFMASGRKDDPIAIVAYPGATAIIGSITGPLIAARTPNVQRTSDHWVIAGLSFRGNQEALDITDSTDWRLVANHFTCPNGFGPTGCVEISQATNIAFLGNSIDDVGKRGTTKVYHGLYFSTDSNHIDVGWNLISNIRGCRGIQFHSSPTDPGTGKNQYDIHVHDNVIHDTVCDGINLATINPSAGAVEVYNNLLYNIGQGPDPPDGSANYACIYVQGGSNVGPHGSGVVEIYNNTMYRCGGRRNTDSGAISLSRGSPEQQVHLRNNIIVLEDGVPLLSPNSTAVPLTGDANLIWWLSGKSRSNSVKGFRLADPRLRDPAKNDFHLLDSSPAIGSGVETGRTSSLAGEGRPLNGRTNIGAY